VAVAACYSPVPSSGAPCSPTGACPSGLECRSGVCERPGAADPDATTDTPRDDAATDAPHDAAAYVPWSTPTPLPGINSNAVEDDPSFTADRLTMMFTSDRAGGLGGPDLYIATRASVGATFTVTALTALSSSAFEQSPEISADGNTLRFTSNRSGTNVVYISTRSGGVWSAPATVPELATIDGDDVAISPDQLTALGIDFTVTGNKIMRATRASKAVPFGALADVIPLEITTDLAAPTLTDGGATVYFHAGASRDIYVSHLVGGVYMTPTKVTELDTSGRDAAPFVSATDDYMMFERDGDLYETSR
jgi:hypothetical protein